MIQHLRGFEEFMKILNGDWVELVKNMSYLHPVISVGMTPIFGGNQEARGQDVVPQCPIFRQCIVDVP